MIHLDIPPTSHNESERWTFFWRRSEEIRVLHGEAAEAQWENFWSSEVASLPASPSWRLARNYTSCAASCRRNAVLKELRWSAWERCRGPQPLDPLGFPTRSCHEVGFKWCNADSSQRSPDSHVLVGIQSWILRIALASESLRQSLIEQQRLQLLQTENQLRLQGVEDRRKGKNMQKPSESFRDLFRHFSAFLEVNPLDFGHVVGILWPGHWSSSDWAGAGVRRSAEIPPLCHPTCFTRSDALSCVGTSRVVDCNGVLDFVLRSRRDLNLRRRWTQSLSKVRLKISALDTMLSPWDAIGCIMFNVVSNGLSEIWLLGTLPQRSVLRSAWKKQGHGRPFCGQKTILGLQNLWWTFSSKVEWRLVTGWNFWPSSKKASLWGPLWEMHRRQRFDCPGDESILKAECLQHLWMDSMFLPSSDQFALSIVNNIVHSIYSMGKTSHGYGST